MLTLAAVGCGGDPSGGQAPKVTTTTPSDKATAVALNVRPSASFDLSMDALNASTFVLEAGTEAVAGTVAMAEDGKAATFTPSSPLLAGTAYTVTITRDAKSSEGVATGEDRSWSFTTGTQTDATAPHVTETFPRADRTAVAINTRVIATFSEPMQPQTITDSSFSVKQGATQIAGVVVYGPGTTAMFTSTSALPANTLFTVTISPAAMDLQGNPLGAAFTWSFTTGTSTASGPAPVGLGAAGDYAVLAKTAVSTVPDSAVTGDIGIGPAAASYLTGFSLVADATNVFASSPQVTGRLYAADYASPTPTNLTTAVSNMEGAYTDAAGRADPDFLELGTGDLGGRTLTPGLYKWTSTVTIPEDVTISGGADDVWIFQTTGDLSMSAAKRITLSGGAQAKNVFWQVAGKATFGANSHFEGILICKTEATLQTGASMNGRILAQTQVALQQATLTQPAQ